MHCGRLLQPYLRRPADASPYALPYHY